MKTKKLVMAALFTALMFLLTYFCKIPIYNGGYIHLGIVGMVLAMYKLGKYTGSAAVTLGSLLADWMIAPFWMPWTLVIKPLTAYLIWLSFGKSLTKQILLILLAGLVTIAGYYLAEAFIYSNWITPVLSTPFLLLEYIAGVIIGFVLVHKKVLD